MAKIMFEKDNDFASQLDGGDLRSIGNANKVVQDVENQNSFDILFKELFNSERKIVMRAADAIEKITLKTPNYLLKHKIQLLSLLKTAKEKELKWYLALLISRIKLTDEELGIVWQILSNWIADKNESKIVRVNSMQGLYNLLPQKQELQQDFELTLSELQKENIPSINARIKRLRSNSR